MVGKKIELIRQELSKVQQGFFVTSTQITDKKSVWFFPQLSKALKVHLHICFCLQVETKQSWTNSYLGMLLAV
jgi:hypothetical protein